MSEATPSAEWPAQIGPYRISRKLGEGGMGVVLEGLHESIARRVAVKLLRAEHARDEDAVQRLFTEARAANIIEHPSVVCVSEVGRLADGSPYLVMDLVAGESLGARLRRDGKPTIVVALELAWQIADVITAAHARGILHRDLKPDNVMLSFDSVASSGERVKVLDFGLAKEVRSGGAQTSQSAIMGTPRYMAPEQCRGGGEVDDRADVYALGVMLYELLAGRAPFDGERGELIGAHLFKEPPLLSNIAKEVPLGLEQLTHRLLAKDREERPRMAEVRQALHAQLLTLRSQPESSSSTAKEEPGPRRPRQRIAARYLLIGGLLLSVLSISTWSFLRRARTEPLQTLVPISATVSSKSPASGSPPAVMPASTVTTPPTGSEPQLVRRPLGLRNTSRRSAKRSGTVAPVSADTARAASRPSSFDDVD